MKLNLLFPGFCCLFVPFHHFWWVLRCLSQLSIDKVKAGQSSFETSEPRDYVVSHQSSDLLSGFPFQCN